MPKIKLSALATDIKGKAGGSVFARNSGGLYFRDNPSGGGRKTPKWAAARSAFASLAGKWRNLTNAQKDAWNAAVDNYNTTGAFGDIRVPSGYELFMRLNGPLNKLGLPLIDVPQSPEPLPEIGQMSLTTTKEFLFTPYHGYAPYGVSLSNACSNDQDCDRPGMECVNGDCVFNPDGSVIDAPIDFSQSSKMVFSGLFFIPDSAFPTDSPKSRVNLTREFEPGNAQITFFIEKVDGDQKLISLTTNDDTNNAAAISSNFTYTSKQPIRLTFIVNFNDFSKTRFFVNQQEISIDTSTDPQAPLDTSAMNLDVVPKSLTGYSNIIIQDTRVFKGNLSTTDLGKLVYGYKVDNPLIHLSYDVSKNASFKNFGTLDQSNFGPGPYNPSVEKTYPKIDFNVRPWLLLFSDTVGVANEVLIFKSTSPSSSGKIGNRVGYRRIGVVDWENKQYFQFGDDFIEEFGAVINNSTIRIEVQTLNTTTGQMSEPTQIDFVANTYGLHPNVGAQCSVDSDCAGGATCIDGICVDFMEDDEGDKEFKPKFKAGAELSKA